MLVPRILLPLAALAALALPATASAVSFSPARQLPHGDPKAHPFYQGGEPSLAFDPTGDGHVYVTAPQGIPTAAGGLAGADANQGVSSWASADSGQTFDTNVLTGAGNGGGDSDVEVLDDHTVLVADLEAAATDICTSRDFGRTFPDCDGGVATNQQGPENDREWLTRGTKPGEVYLTYHDFAGGFPIIERSTDGGQTFAPCGTIIDPAGPAAQNYTPAGGTLVSKPVIDGNDDIYVEFATPDATAAPVGASLNHMYMAVAKAGCTGQTVFTDHLIYEDPDANLANIFQASGLDGGGELYVLIGGNLDKTDAGRTNLYLFTSTDGGATWKHVRVNSDDLGANVLPAVAGGAGKGEAVLGWFGSTSKDPNDTTAQWRYYAATTFDGGRTFSQATVTPDVIHYGDICTQGIFCGLIPGQPGNRNLADFSSAAINPRTSCAALAIPGDPYNRPDLPGGDNNSSSSAYVSLQQNQGDCLTAANAGKAAATVGSSVGGAKGAGCVDRAAPVSRVSAMRRHHGRVRITGTSHDRGCGPSGLGRVARVRVAVARDLGHRRCRFARADGTLRKTEPCGHGHYLAARGGSRWSLTLPRRLPRGRYLVRVRARDRAGNQEHGSRRNVRFSRLR